MRLTEKRIRDLEPKDSQYFVWDDAIPGFGVRVGAGGVKSYVLRYRVGGGREGQQRRATLAKCDAITVDDARRLARENLASIRSGGDPLGDKRLWQQEPTCVDLFQRYLTEHAQERKSPRSIAEDKRYIDNFLLPRLGARKVSTISLTDVEALHRNLKATPVQANRVLALLSKALNLAERWHMREIGTNPCSAVGRYKERHRERYFSPSELRRIGTAMDNIADAASPQAMLALRLAFLLGLRIGEILRIRWQDINFELGVLTLHETKTGRRSLTLPSAAQALLSQAPRVGNFVIYGRSADRPLDYKSVHKVWRRIAQAAELEDARIHDIRHTTATIAAGTGAGAHLVRDLIGHRTLTMANLYVGRMAEPVRDLRERVADTVSATLAGETPAPIVRKVMP